MEAYRSGHNGPDSKSGRPQGLVGSNPTASAKAKARMFAEKPVFMRVFLISIYLIIETKFFLKRVKMQQKLKNATRNATQRSVFLFV